MTGEKTNTLYAHVCIYRCLISLELNSTCLVVCFSAIFTSFFFCVFCCSSLTNYTFWQILHQLIRRRCLYVLFNYSWKQQIGQNGYSHVQYYLHTSTLVCVKIEVRRTKLRVTGLNFLLKSLLFNFRAVYFLTNISLLLKENRC